MENKAKQVQNWGNKSKEAKKPTRSWFEFFRGNNLPPPAGTLKKNGKLLEKKGGRLAEQNLRALSELSMRSLNTIKANLKTMKNKKNRRTLRKALNMTRRK